MSTHQAGEKAKEQARPWIENLARFGYAARGVVFIVIGFLSLQAARGSGGQTTDPQGALKTISQQSFGQVMLFILGVGLLGYAIWRLVMALCDSENKGSDAKGVAKRIGYALTGLAYGGLAFTAFQLVRGAQAQSGNLSRADWTARVLAQPFGRWLIVLAGLIVIGIALNTLYKAYSAKFLEPLNTGTMSQTEKTWVTRAGRAGYAARGVVFIPMGWFLIRAGLQSDAQETGGLGQALSALAQQPYGPWLLGIVATGLIAYGLFSFCEAYYRRVDA
jgi:hypothetical protein